MSTSALNKIAGLAGRSTKKDTKPTIHEPALAEPIAVYIARKQEAETAKALADAAAEQIVSAVRPQRLKICATAGKVVSSVSVNGILTFTQTCRYCNVPQERKDALAEAFPATFDRYFSDTLQIGLKKESANNEVFLTKLLDALGEDEFSAHFDVRRDLVVNDAFHNDYSTRAEVQAVAQPFMDEQTIRPYAPSLKIQ